jgi:6-pyruvoyltetrahydropterin/6-carboxytetrahydropterin synthase
MYELIIKGEFSAAHNLRGYKGKCEQLHGHNYGVELYIRQSILNKSGIAIDFTVLKKLLDKALSEYDHRHLNELRDFAKLNPTAENIAYMIHRKIKKTLPGKHRLKVCIWESAKTGACYCDVM